MLIRGGLIEESLSQGGGRSFEGEGAQLKIYYLLFEGGGGRIREGALFRGNTVSL